MFKKNVGTTDRIIRIILGLALLAAGWYYGSWWGLVGLLPFFTGAFGTCGLYTLIGVNTCCCKEGDKGNGGGCCCGKK